MSQMLIVSASTGTGHVRAAEALREAMRETAPGVAVQHVDLLDLAPRWVRAAYGTGYEMIATRTPKVWRELYHRTDFASPELARWGPAMHRLLFREFRNLLLSRPWEACICTHFLPGQLAARTAGAPPFGMAITDLTLHHFWAQPRISRYFVAGDTLAAELRVRVPGVAVETTGIPISPRFSLPIPTELARQGLGIGQARPTVLVVGGGLGVGVELAAEAAVGATIPGLQVVAICGRNEAARDRLLVHSAASSGRLHVRGMVDDIERYMAAADVVVTKPGGLTTAEVLAFGKPLVLTQAIPGQEEGNTRVLCASGAALHAPGSVQVRSQLERIFGDVRVFQAMVRAAQKTGRPRASLDIAELVLAAFGNSMAA